MLLYQRVNLGGLGWWTQGIQTLDPNHGSTNPKHQSQPWADFRLFDQKLIRENVEKIEDTVDGRNPAPVEVGSLSHYLQGFSTIPGGCLGFCSSTVSFYTHLSVCVFLVSNSSRPLLHRTWATKLCSWSFQGNLRKFLGNLGVGEILFHLAGYMDPMIYPLASES